MEVCTKCANPKIIIKRKQSGQALCKNCFIENIQKKAIKTIKKENLIDKGDKILVALSGGKDSVATLDILNTFKERNIIDLCAVTVDEGIANYREDGIAIARKHTKRLGIEHKVVSFKDSFDTDLDEIMKVPNHRISCSYCGVFRRWIINRAARDFEADKIATGHNLDDEVQAILMNYLEGNIDNLKVIGAKTQSKSPLFRSKIKPLREIPEKEIGLYTIAKDLEIHLAGCPYAQKSFRGEISEIIKNLSKNHPTIMYSTLRGFDKIKIGLKKEYSNDFQFDSCIKCGEPSSNEICRVCTFLDELGKKVAIE
ncbi:MAG: TIGR00269 family protein [Methanobacteriaceae archaeon]|nr:TIGR00269 family protein [Candidatus Methanorudis spinitermitis]